jgi:hypothetical protein
MSSGEKLKQFKAADFKANWKLTDNRLLCADKNFAYINNAIKGE